MLRRIAVKAAHSESTKWEKPLGNTHLYRSIDQENGEIRLGFSPICRVEARPAMRV
jgi:hypothetical protein